MIKHFETDYREISIEGRPFTTWYVTIDYSPVTIGEQHHIQSAYGFILSGMYVGDLLKETKILVTSKSALPQPDSEEKVLDFCFDGLNWTSWEEIR